jgi:hypothetical protein
VIFDKPVATWIQEDLQFLVDRGIEESRLLEYKQERSSPRCAVIALLDNLTPFQIQTLVAPKSSDTLSGLFSSGSLPRHSLRSHCRSPTSTTGPSELFPPGTNLTAPFFRSCLS